jgi:hypothetical protein
MRLLGAITNPDHEREATVIPKRRLARPESTSELRRA